MSTAEIFHQLEELPEQDQKTASDFIAFLLAKTKAGKAVSGNNALTEMKEKPATGFGCMKGMFKMAPDFDEPLEDFKDYM